MEIATKMIIETCGGIAGSIISDNSFNFKEVEIEINNLFVNEVLGIEIEKNLLLKNSKLLVAMLMKKIIRF